MCCSYMGHSAIVTLNFLGRYTSGARAIVGTQDMSHLASPLRSTQSILNGAPNQRCIFRIGKTLNTYHGLKIFKTMLFSNGF